MGTPGNTPTPPTAPYSIFALKLNWNQYQADPEKTEFHIILLQHPSCSQQGKMSRDRLSCVPRNKYISCRLGLPGLGTTHFEVCPSPAWAQTWVFHGVRQAGPAHSTHSVWCIPPPAALARSWLFNAEEFAVDFKTGAKTQILLLHPLHKLS